MFAFLTTAAKFVIKWAPAVLPLLIYRPNKKSPTISLLEALQHIERIRRGAEENAQYTQDLAREFAQGAERERERADRLHEEAQRAAARAAEEMERMRARMEEAADAARRAEGAANAAREDAAESQREALEERERAQKMREEAEGSVKAAKEEAERAQRAADEQRRQAEAAQARAEGTARTAAEEARKANEAREEAERRWKDGIQPVVTPSPEELAAAKRRIQYREDCFHFAIAGISGSGKSSLVNAFRGLRSRDPGAAAVGATETTLQMSRYPDTNPNSPFVWYDIPGAGTLKCRDWQYFNDQGLYVFDCIIVLFDNRFTMTDIAILTNARRFNIPTYIVRSKADQHIRNVVKEMGYNSEEDDDEDVERRNALYKAARKQFVDETRKSVRVNLEDANLPNQRVYIVSNNTLLSIVLNKVPKKTIDEVDLLNDLFNEAYRRRRVEPVVE